MRRSEEGDAWFAQKAALLGAPHMRDLERARAAIERLHGPTPHFDPHDGGAEATVLLLLEAPGPGAAPLRFVSRDNPTGTARNIARFCGAAGLERRSMAIWNAVPWIIHRPGARNRAPAKDEVEAGLAALPAVLDLLPMLRVAVLAGRVAARARPILDGRGLPVLRMPHPSPVYVVTDPAIAPGMIATLAEARSMVA